MPDADQFGIKCEESNLTTKHLLFLCIDSQSGQAPLVVDYNYYST